MKSFLCAVAFSTLAFGASAATVSNGDFETGDLSGWTVTSTSLGATGIAEVDAFDTDGAGASDAAHFQVGRATMTRGSHQGIILSQTVSILSGGLYSFAADVAALGGPRNANLSGGLFQLIVGGNVLDTFDAGRIESRDVSRDTLMGELLLGVGDIDLAIRITRPFAFDGTTPQQFVDNVTAQNLSTVPLPAGLPLLVAGLGGLALIRRKG